MTDLRKLNSAVQNATYPGHEFAQAVREVVAAIVDRVDRLEGSAVQCPSCGWWSEGDCPDCKPEPTSEGAKVECPNCKAAVEQPWAHYPGGWRCPTLPAQPEAPGLLEAVQRISDSIGWRSTQGDDPTLYYCEFCSEAHPDWRNVPHHDECPVFVIRAAIAKATTPMSNKPAQPQPAVRIQTMEEAMEESLRMVRGEPASPVEMLNVECSVCCSLEPCAHDCAEPAAPSEMSEAVFFRKKPVVIEAMQYTGHNGHKLRNWSAGVVVESPVLEIIQDDNPSGRYVQIVTLEGTMTGIVGDWIIKGVNGEFYPCKPDIFAKTYEAVERSQVTQLAPVRMTLPKVRALLNRLWSGTGPEISDNQIIAALDELDAAEKP